MDTTLLKGLKKTKNASGHSVLWLHYSADPSKDPDTEDGKAWVEAEEKKYYGGRSGLKWRAEMEMDFNAGLGELVFPTLIEIEDKVFIDPFDIDDSFTLYGGMDWGTRNPVSFHVYAEDQNKNFYSIWEYYAQRALIGDVAQAIRMCPYYDRLQWIACDPTMFSQTIVAKDGFTSVTEMITDHDVVGNFTVDKLMPGHGRSDQSMIEKMKVLWNMDNPGMKIFKTCPNQIQEIRNLKYPERQEHRNETEKILDKNNHAWDDMKYFLLSHPYAIKTEQKPKFGTVAYYNEISDMASMAAARKGTSVQDEFNNLWGTTL